MEEDPWGNQKNHNVGEEEIYIEGLPSLGVIGRRKILRSQRKSAGSWRL